MKHSAAIRACLVAGMLLVGLWELSNQWGGRSAAQQARAAPVVSAPIQFMPLIHTRSQRASPLRAWQHLSSARGDLPTPGPSTEQTAALVGDLSGDGLNDFVIASRLPPGPSVQWYERLADGGWAHHVIETDALPIEAGGALHDIDGDGDLDLALGTNNRGNEIWWWENPHPDGKADWTRRAIKRGGAGKHHDMLFGQFDDDPAVEFVYWNQGALQLFVVDVPVDPRATQPWPNAHPIYTAPSARYEGLAKADVNADGRLDILAGGRWFEYRGGDAYRPHLIADVELTRIAAGDLRPGGWLEVVMSPGDADGPARWYEWDGVGWVAVDLFGHAVKQAHSLELGDVNGDNLLDIFIAEMAFAPEADRHNPNAQAWLLYGDGEGGFTPQLVASGVGNHESRLADLDGDGDLDILGKPFSWQTPRVDVWLNQGDRVGIDCGPLANWTWRRHLIDPARPGRAAFLFPFDVDGDGRRDFITGKFWYANPGAAGGAWARHPLPAPIEDTIAAYDFDGDGDLDLLATTGPTLPNDQGFWWPVVWARNDGGSFTVFDNLDTAGVSMPRNDPIQGVAIARFTTDGPLEVALTWDDAENPNRNPYGVQMFTVPADPATGTWARRKLSDISVGEQLTAADLDADTDLDLFMGDKWLRNDGAAGWTPISIITVTGNQQTSRHHLHDVDGDGDLDALIGFSHSPRDRRIAWYEHPADPATPWPGHLVGLLDLGAAESMDVVDLDGDGDVDVVAGEYNARFTEEQPGASLWIFENLGGGSEWVRRLVHKGDSHYQSSRVADMDGDGDYDIVAKGWFKNEVYLYENITACAGSGG